MYGISSPDNRLTSARAGDIAALGELLDLSRDYLLWITRRTLDPELRAKAGQSDLVQDTLLEAHQDFGSFHGTTEEELLAWLRRLLLNNIANCVRRFRGTKKRSINREQSIDQFPRDQIAELKSGIDNPACEIERREQRELLNELILELRPDQRRVMQMWFEDLSFEQIGEKLAKSSNACRMIWMRAIENLQRMAGAAR